jgi:hypothetical protein
MPLSGEIIEKLEEGHQKITKAEARARESGKTHMIKYLEGVGKEAAKGQAVPPSASAATTLTKD